MSFNANGEFPQARTARQRAREAGRAERVARSFENLCFAPWDEPDGEDWYTRAHADIRAEYGFDADLFADLLAATSPQTDVRENVKLARLALERHRKGEPQEPWIPSHARNIERALRGEPLSGPKVRAFAAALKGDVNAVVVDTWMLRAAGLGSPKRVQRPSSFRVTHLAIRLVAERQKLPAAVVQARVWLAYRKANWNAKKGAGDGYLPIK